jgi:AMMECR1 domain-containing protein
VRHERKKHGSLKLIEGPIDPSEPTVVIDDSISSGTSMQQACDTLRAAGLRVEGGIFLVRFGWYGGFARMHEQGYRVDAVTDIWNDFIYHMDGEPKPIGNPTKIFPEFRWSDARAPDGLHPAELARLAMRDYLASGTLPRPPRTLDADYPAGGGAWVSLRDLDDIHLRHARDGYWNFPGEEPFPAPEAVMRAALKTASTLSDGQENGRSNHHALGLLNGSAIAVTFFGAMEECPVGGLDNDRYGIVVRSLERPGWMGGALPRMPGILNEWDQYRHARITNAGLVSFEPHIILRHEVVKAVQPDVTWQPTGVPLGATASPLTNAEYGGAVAARARDLVLARIFGGSARTAPLSDDLVPATVDSLYVSIYLTGKLRGCFGTALRHLDEDIATLVEAALRDNRFEPSIDVNSPEAVAVSVALLHDRVELGVHSIEDIVRRIRYGQHALMVEQDDHVALFLPSVASRHNLSPTAFVEELLQKAEIAGPPYRWIRFECACWLADKDEPRLMDGSFAPETPPATLAELLARLVPLTTGYLLRHLRPDGNLFTRYEPLQDRLDEGVDLPRLAHAGWVLARASAKSGLLKSGLVKSGRATHDPSAGEAAARIIGYLVNTIEETAEGCWLACPGHDRSVAEIALLVLALCESPDRDLREHWVPRLAATLWSQIDCHGHIRTHADGAAGSEPYQDYFPGQVLLALAVAARAGLTTVDDTRLTRSFRSYRHRFQVRPHFGQVSWLAQACQAWWQVRRDADFAALAFEIADWILLFQQAKTGAFLNDHQSDTPGYTTALYLEGIGAAAHLARALEQHERHRCYLDSCRRSLQFLDGLIIQPRDASLLPNPSRAIGGLRRSARSSEIYVDFVQHGLAALIGIGDAMEATWQGTKRRRDT